MHGASHWLSCGQTRPVIAGSPSYLALSAAGRKTLRRAPRPAVAAAVYFAIAFVLNHSGKAAAISGGRRAWAMNPDHRSAKKKARDMYYASYSVQICDVKRESKFDRKAKGQAAE